MFSLFGIGSNKDTVMESKILAGHFSGEIKVMVPRKGTTEPLVHHADKIVDLLEKDIVKQEKDFTTKAVVHLWIALAALNKTSMLPCEENVFTHAIMKSRRYEGSFDIKAFDRMLVSKSASSDVEFEGTLMHNISDSSSGINIYLSIQYSALFVADNVNSVEGKGYGSIDISTSDVFKNFHKHF